MKSDYFQWGVDFVTGIESIDSQHFKLVEIINQILKLSFDSNPEDGYKADILKNQLYDYVTRHFRDEENIMSNYKIDLRHVDLHRKSHADFIIRIKKVFKKFSDNPTSVNLDEISEFLIRWLAYHILNTDQSLVRQINLIERDGLSPKEAFDKEAIYVEKSTEPLLKALKALFYMVTEKNNELEQKNIELEEKVKQRTKELQISNSKLEILSMKDELTNIGNKRYAMIEIQKAIEMWKRYGTTFSLLFIDVDKFKSINDNFGHEYGDKVLKWISDLLENNIRKTDIVCRVGGDEFIIICPNTDEKSGIILGQNLVEKAKAMDDQEILSFWNPSLSIGVAEINQSFENPLDIIKAADGAMYRVKKSGSMINIIAFIGPSGSGKTTLSEKLKLNKIVTYTTRKPRKGEIDAKDYFFIDEEKFRDMISSDSFLEYSEYNGNFYGTDINAFDKAIEEKSQVAVILDINGINKLKQLYGEKVLVIGVYCPLREANERVSLREDENLEIRMLNFSKEIETMIKACDILINNSMEKWKDMDNIIKIISKGIK